jgi:hypothetical protein
MGPFLAVGSCTARTKGRLHSGSGRPSVPHDFVSPVVVDPVVVTRHQGEQRARPTAVPSAASDASRQPRLAAMARAEGRGPARQVAPGGPRSGKRGRRDAQLYPWLGFGSSSKLPPWHLEARLGLSDGRPTRPPELASNEPEGTCARLRVVEAAPAETQTSDRRPRGCTRPECVLLDCHRQSRKRRAVDFDTTCRKIVTRCAGDTRDGPR